MSSAFAWKKTSLNGSCTCFATQHRVRTSLDKKLTVWYYLYMMQQVTTKEKAMAPKMYAELTAVAAKLKTNNQKLSYELAGTKTLAQLNQQTLAEQLTNRETEI